MYLSHSRRAFTLVELAIVLVIIGLIVGGVLVGQDLIKAAGIRANVTQIERYDTAANTFLNKYNGLPGDLRNPTRYFSSVTNATGGDAQGDGDGLIETVRGGLIPCTSYSCISGEALLFWYELSQAGLITEASTVSDMATVSFTPSDSNMPMLRTGENARITLQADTGRNYYIIMNPNANGNGIVNGRSNPTGNFGAGLSPFTAYNMDVKMDDGVPTSGKFVSIPAGQSMPTAIGWGSPAATFSGFHCYVSDTTPPVYATNSYNGANVSDTAVCTISIRASF